jgi:hypothetical protein
LESIPPTPCDDGSNPSALNNSYRALQYFDMVDIVEFEEIAERHRIVVAIDISGDTGHRVPTSRYVERVYMGPGESIDALVEMNRPGRWILGTTHREDRIAGLGRLVEYAGATGPPVEGEYGIANWDYTWFGAAAAADRPIGGCVALRRCRYRLSTLNRCSCCRVTAVVRSGQ